MYILAILRVIVIVVTMAGYLSVYMITRLFVPHTSTSAFKLRRFWLKTIAIPVLNIHIEVEGSPINEPALYVCNHRSFSDPIILCQYVDAYVIAKAEVAKYPIINKGAEITGIIYVDREDKDSRKATRRALVEIISGGNNVMVYPEGTVGVDKNTLPFRKGTFLTAAEEGIPVVPVSLEYRDEKDMWSNRGLISQYFRQFRSWRTEAKLSFGPRLMIDDGVELEKQAHSWINEKLSEQQSGWSTVFKLT